MLMALRLEEMARETIHEDQFSSIGLAWSFWFAARICPCELIIARRKLPCYSLHIFGDDSQHSSFCFVESIL